MRLFFSQASLIIVSPTTYTRVNSRACFRASKKSGMAASSTISEKPTRTGNEMLYRIPISALPRNQKIP
jgi:hypothetical protein